MLVREYDLDPHYGVLVGAATGYDYDCVFGACTAYEEEHDDVIPIVAPYVGYSYFTALLSGNAIHVAAELKF